MTCGQARQLLAAFRRDDCSPSEAAELQAHLAGCEGCRARDAAYEQVGAVLRSLPEIAPPPEFYARVLAAARADEAATREPTTAKKLPKTVVVPGLADASYFPTLRRAVQERRVRVVSLRRRVSPAATFALRYGAALAAVFLVLVVGLSLTLWQLLRVPTAPLEICISKPCRPFLTSVYTPDPAYPLVADAIGSDDGQRVVYAAHTADGKWMLEVLTEPSRESVALLPAPVAGPLTLEGWARGWVLWVQGDANEGDHWNLYATQLSPALSGAATTLHVMQGGRAAKSGPVALHGVHAFGALVLVAEELADGHGELLALDLRQVGTVQALVLASAPPGHVIADPTSDGASVYWADEWISPDGGLHGDIDRLAPDGSAVAVTSNGVSFSPMLVANKLVYLEVPAAQAGQPGDAQQTPTATPTPAGVLTPPGSGASTAPVAGVLWVEDADGRADLDSGARKPITDAGKLAFLPEAGATFVVWQEGNGAYALYDVTKDQVWVLTSYIPNAVVLAVAPRAVLWVSVEGQGATGQAPVKMTINLLAWPQK